jgi:hypothetical protein
MNSLFDRLKRLFSGQSQATRDGNGNGEQISLDAMELNDDSLLRLMRLIEHTEDGQYGCEETLDLLDEYAELVVNHQDANILMPLVKGHLEHCIDCTERYEALVKILESS